MPYYLWKCRACNVEIDVLRKMADYQQAPTTEEISEEKCGHVWERLISDVSFQSTERHVGKNERAQDSSYQALKESYKVEKEMMNMPHDKRGEHKKKIDLLRKADK